MYTVFPDTFSFRKDCDVGGDGVFVSVKKNLIAAAILDARAKLNCLDIKSK